MNFDETSQHDKMLNEFKCIKCVQMLISVRFILYLLQTAGKLTFSCFKLLKIHLRKITISTERQIGKCVQKSCQCVSVVCQLRCHFSARVNQSVNHRVRQRTVFFVLRFNGSAFCRSTALTF